MQINTNELEIILLALNDREGCLSTDWENASKANSVSLMLSLCDELRELRKLADKIGNSLIVAKKLAA